MDDLPSQLAAALRSLNAGDALGAEAILRLAMKEHGESPEGRLMLAESLRQGGRAAESLEEARRVLDSPRDDGVRLAASAAAGFALESLGRHGEALPMFLASKPDPSTLPSGVLYFANELKMFMEASRRDLSPWTVASWCPAPDYRAFSTPPTFVVGFPWSGSGLLGRMLGAHGRWLVVGERPALARLREHLQRHAGGMDKVPAYLGQLGEGEIRILRAMYFDDMERAVPTDSARGGRLVDRNPINLVHLPIVRRLFPDAPVIVCVRDARDAVLSAIRRPSRHPASVNFTSVASAAEFGAAVLGLWVQFREVLGLRTLEVRFEELLADPGRVMRSVGSFLEEPNNGAAPLPPTLQASECVGRWRRYGPSFANALGVLAPALIGLGYRAE